tara:strand:- start:1651 stop:2085 length:435 start_codon:yes stop_codon:yes gene_type:complete
MKTIKDTPGRENDKSPTHKIVFNQIQQRIIDQDTDAVEYCQKEYPDTCDAFLNILADQYVLFCKKQKNYGPGNISVGTNLRTDADVKLSLTGLWFRINDKVQRLKQLIILGHADEVGESELDTFQDLSVYGIIAQLVSAKVWGK